MMMPIKIMIRDITKMMSMKEEEEEGARSHVKDFINVLATDFGETMLISLGQRRLPDSYRGSIP